MIERENKVRKNEKTYILVKEIKKEKDRENVYFDHRRNRKGK